MIEAFQYINKAFESKVRLGIMAILMVNEEADFNFLKEQLSLGSPWLLHSSCAMWAPVHILYTLI